MNIPPPPAELAHLAQLLGAEGLYRLIDAHGGTRFYVPRSPAPDCDLVTLVGLPAAEALAAEHGGIWLKIPVARRWQAQVLKAQGRSGREIARHLRTTENTVRLLLKGPPDTRQMGLPL